jgi:hypothetical protein
VQEWALLLVTILAAAETEILKQHLQQSLLAPAAPALLSSRFQILFMPHSQAA